MEDAGLHDGEGAYLGVTQVDGGNPTRKRRPPRDAHAGEIEGSFSRPKSRIDDIGDLTDIAKLKSVGIETSHREENSTGRKALPFFLRR